METTIIENAGTSAEDDCVQSTSKSEGKYPEDMYSEPWYRKQIRPTCNLVAQKNLREMGGSRHRIPYQKLNNDIITTLPLYRASVGEMIDRDFIISWTPDGNRLICVSTHGNAVKIYRYLGIQNSRNEYWDFKVISKLLEFEFQISPQFAHGFMIHLDTIYFTSCGRFFIFAAGRNVPLPAGYVNDNENNESLDLPPSLDDITIYCVDIQEQILTGERTFLMDKIVLNNCVSISGHMLLIMAPLNQIMYIMRIHPESGRLMPLKEIGPAIRDMEEVYGQIRAERAREAKNKFYNSLKQIMMIYLYQKAKRQKKVMEILRSTAYYESLRIFSTYLFEEYYILIRMMPKEWNMKTAAAPCFFIIMDWREATILDIFEQFDERFHDFTIKARLSLTFPLTSSAWVGASNYPNHADRMLGQADKPDKSQTKTERSNTKFDDHPEISRRVLNQLPFGGHTQYKISLQSPYLDSNNYQVSQKVFSGIFSGKIRTDQEDPRFMITRTKKMGFQLTLSMLAQLGIHIASLLFHPRDPLCLVIDRARISPSAVVYQLGLERDKDELNGGPKVEAGSDVEMDSEESDLEEILDLH